MIEFFSWFGMSIFFTAVIIGVTAFIGWISDDDDYALRWLFTCMAFGVCLAIYTMSRAF